LQKPTPEIRKIIWLLIAFGISAYAIYGLIDDDLVMPYRWLGRSQSHTGLLHLHGMWAVGGSICLLLGAAGFVILFLGTLGEKPGGKPGAGPYQYLAGGLISVGCLFFLGVSTLTHWFIR
jgi:hypothetical protein